MTGSQWTGLTVAVISAVTLIVWAMRPRDRASPHVPEGEELLDV
jgi:hypothetical protein